LATIARQSSYQSHSSIGNPPHRPFQLIRTGSFTVLWCSAVMQGTIIEPHGAGNSRCTLLLDSLPRLTHVLDIVLAAFEHATQRPV